MDPRFQHQKDPSHPQNPTDNPSPNTTGPNIYPTLPPINNPQYQPHAQQYGQNYPRNNPYNPSAGHTGYVPLANYGNGPYQGENAESVLNAEKMREMEKGLETCFIKCYQVWLWLTIIYCGMSIYKAFVALSTENPDFPLLILAGLLYSIWAIVQSVFGIQAIAQKSLSKATVACLMMVTYLVPSIFAIIWLLAAIICLVPDTGDVSMKTFLAYAVVNSLICIFINLIGAFKVRNILDERNVLQEKIDRSDYSIQLI